MLGDGLASPRAASTALFLAAAMPLAWIACGGGETKPPETAASEDGTDGGSSSSSEKTDKADKTEKEAPAASSAAEDTAREPWKFTHSFSIMDASSAIPGYDYGTASTGSTASGEGARSRGRAR